MATYDPPQPLWKRNLVGALDFLLAAILFAILISRFFPSPAHAPTILPNGAATHEMFSLGTWQILLLAVLIIAYFVVLGRTGGTMFQRLFGMKRAKGA